MSLFAPKPILFAVRGNGADERSNAVLVKTEHTGIWMRKCKIETFLFRLKLKSLRIKLLIFFLKIKRRAIHLPGKLGTVVVYLLWLKHLRSNRADSAL